MSRGEIPLTSLDLSQQTLTYKLPWLAGVQTFERGLSESPSNLLASRNELASATAPCSLWQLGQTKLQILCSRGHIPRIAGLPAGHELLRT